MFLARKTLSPFYLAVLSVCQLLGRSGLELDNLTGRKPSQTANCLSDNVQTKWRILNFLNLRDFSFSRDWRLPGRIVSNDRQQRATMRDNVQQCKLVKGSLKLVKEVLEGRGRYKVVWIQSRERLKDDSNCKFEIVFYNSGNRTSASLEAFSTLLR